MDIAVVGSDEFVLGFRLAGVRKTYATSPDNMEARIEAVIDDEEVGILVLNDEEMDHLPAGMRKRLETLPRPVVIAVGQTEEEDLRTKVKRAIGIDLFQTT